MGTLDGRHALITGGGTGIGAAIARALAAEGAAVSLAGRRKGPLHDVASSCAKAAAIVADITKPEDCAAMVAAARTAHGPIDIVIANAGMAASAPAGKITPAQWQETIAVNLTGAFLTVQAALADVTRATDGQRRIVFIASTAGLKGYPYVAAYVAAKHGVVGLTRALSLELGASGVTVNAVCPGFTDTPLLTAAADNISAKTGRSAAQSRETLAKDNAHGRLITPEEVAQTVLWLCSPGAASVNGQAIAVSGGPA
ncbi:MAG: SDR family oxidoreductase [Pseudolabrys sp.]|nr:SDR family oxidoreductase [Pseudolabrys sp.]